MVASVNKPLNLSENERAYLSTFLKDNFGVYFPETKYKDLERGIIHIMEKTGETDVNACIEKMNLLSPSSPEVEALITQFTVGETYFFREPDYFAALKSNILPNIIESRRNTGQILRVWSAGCSTGEEPYSLAILISELIENLDNWNITILATDINVRSLRKLAEGIYGEWSFRNVPNYIKEKYFIKHTKNTYEIKPIFKKMVKANYLNLARDPFPSLMNNTNAMDVIFCRNVLMYFDTPLINQILSQLTEALIEGGCLAVGSSEHSLMPPSQHQKTIINNAIFYQKKTDVLLREENPYYRTKTIPESEFRYESQSALSSEQDTIPEPEMAAKPLFGSKDETFIQPFSKKQKSLDSLGQNSDTKSYNISDTETQKIAEHKTETNEEKELEDIQTLSRKLANEGKLKEALDLLERGIEKDKCNTFLHYFKALVLVELELPEEAIAELNKTIYLDPNYILAYFSLGNIAINQQRLGTARKYYSIVLSLIKQYLPEDEIPGSEGYLTMARMQDIIESKKLFQLE